MNQKEARIISITNRKGGVGKSTLSILLATSLANQLQKKVLIIDMDSQNTVQTLFDLVSDSEIKPLFDVVSINPDHLKDELIEQETKYDVIFLDLPRITESVKAKDIPTINSLQYCDSVLIPILASTIDVLSSVEYYNVIKAVAKLRNGVKLPFIHKAILNRVNSRKINEIALNHLNDMDVPLMNSNLGDYATFQNVDPTIDVLTTSEGEKRFRLFFDEFIQTFKFN